MSPHLSLWRNPRLFFVLFLSLDWEFYCIHRVRFYGEHGHEHTHEHEGEWKDGHVKLPAIDLRKG